MRKRWIFSFFSILSYCAGQSVTPDAFLQAVDGGTLRVPANSASTVFPLKVTAVVEGRDVIRVGLTHPQLQISLITPASIEVTSVNAGSLGYEWTLLNAATPSLNIPFASSAGDHVLIGLPAGAQPGVYQVKANATGIATDSGIQVTYWSNSGVRAGAVCDSTVPTGSPITISGLVFSGTTPVTGAAVTDTMLLEKDITSTTRVVTYQLVSQAPGPAGATDRTYSARLTNLVSGTITLAEARIAEAGGVALLDDSLAFRNAIGGISTASQDTFSVRVPSGETFDPSTLVWEVTSTSDAGSISLPDSGAQDNAPGDGIYTGVFTPATAGKYSALLTFTGTSGTGVAYSRKAVASFQAAAPGGSLVSFQDAAVDDDGDGRKDRLVITATVNVPSAGGYRVSLVLIGSNGEQVNADAKVTLASGSGQVPLAVEGSYVVSGLGVSGPYKIAHIALQKDDEGLTPVIDVRDDAGQTAAYPLSDFDRGAIELTGRTATGVNANGIPGFEILRLTVGVAVHGPAGPCNWIATLGGPAGQEIDEITGGALLKEGESEIALDFRGAKIARGGINGPYKLKEIRLECDDADAESLRYNLIETAALQAAEFENPANDGFTLTSQQTRVAVEQGKRAQAILDLPYTGAFQGPVMLSATGLPAGVTAEFYANPVRAEGKALIALSAGAGAAPGSYPFTVTGTSGSLTRQLALTAEVMTGPVTVSVTPTLRTLLPGETQQFAATVTGHTDQSVTWLVGIGQGAISPTGLYTAPAVVNATRNVRVVALSKLDIFAKAVATVTLNPPAGSVAVTIQATEPGLAFSVSGAGCAAGSYQTPATLQWTPGSACSMSFTSPSPGTVGRQWVFRNWQDGPTANPRAFTAPPAATTYEAVFGEQYRLQIETNPPGSVYPTPSSGQHWDPGAQVRVVALNSEYCHLQGWSPNAPNGLVTMTRPQNVVAAFSFVPPPPVTQVSVQRGEATYDSGASRYRQTVTASNNGTLTVGARLAVQNLTQGLAVVQPLGTVPCLSPPTPFIELGLLQPGQPMQLTLEFTGPVGLQVAWDPLVWPSYMMY